MGMADSLSTQLYNIASRFVVGLAGLPSNPEVDVGMISTPEFRYTENHASCDLEILNVKINADYTFWIIHEWLKLRYSLLFSNTKVTSQNSKKKHKFVYVLNVLSLQEL